MTDQAKIEIYCDGFMLILIRRLCCSPSIIKIFNSVLENHHLATAFNVILDEKYDIAACFNESQKGFQIFNH